MRMESTNTLKLLVLITLLSVATMMPTPSMSKCMVGMPILLLVLQHIDKQYSVREREKGTITYSLIKPFTIGVGLTNSAPIVSSH